MRLGELFAYTCARYTAQHLAGPDTTITFFQTAVVLAQDVARSTVGLRPLSARSFFGIAAKGPTRIRGTRADCS